MEFQQTKLTKAEWDSIEVPLSASDVRILRMITQGYHDVNIKDSPCLTLVMFMKIGADKSAALDSHLFMHYFQATLQEITRKYHIPYEVVKPDAKATNIKKADLIRISNTDTLIQEHKGEILEFMWLDLFKNLVWAYAAPKKAAAQALQPWLYYFYTLKRLLQIQVDYNATLQSKLAGILATLQETMSEPELKRQLLERSVDFIEKNPLLLRCANDELYDHQKQLFSICKRPHPKLIMYTAPTGTGKTMSPLGLAEQHRVIFVCAARHVGLALAKAAISLSKKVAFAFGCSDASDIRLHWFAAKEYTTNYKSGRIQKVDNSQGEKVEIMICDLKSYIPAMLYMLAFNERQNIITYWDEPTISLDYETHPFHDLIHDVWVKNQIPNMVLSSATLPGREALAETSRDFLARFENAQSYRIVSFDCKKTIPLLNREGYVEMPHFLTDNHEELGHMLTTCRDDGTLLRYLDLQSCVDAILQVTPLLPPRNVYHMENVYESLETVTITSIKQHYVNVMKQLTPDMYVKVHPALNTGRKPRVASTINVVTSDAHTLTDGPTIYLAQDVMKIAQFFVQSAQIPAHILLDIQRVIAQNNTLNSQLAVLEKDLEDMTAKDDGKENKNKIRSGQDDRDKQGNVEMKKLRQQIDTLRMQVQSVFLPPVYVPNTKDHLYKHALQFVRQSASHKAQPFTCDLAESTVEAILRIDDIDDQHKLVLLMGIGVFAQHSSDRYVELIKQLAQEQKLFVILADPDYIYGTNYQFCHGYIGKDLNTMTRDKCIQAMGRVGRRNVQQDYTVRFRDNTLLPTLFLNGDAGPEARNMQRLFVS
jgi:hypothetical protein